MRITGGTLRGRILEAPKGRDIRPTSDKVRLAIFNMLNSRGLVDNAVVLDAFCGTGALGIEALSWGADHAVFIDKNRTSLDLCKKNCTALGVLSSCNHLLKDASKLTAKPEGTAPADLVFLDPPYKLGLVIPALEVLVSGGWVSNTFHAVLETEKEFDPAALTAKGYMVDLERDYGDTKIVLAHIQNAG